MPPPKKPLKPLKPLRPLMPPPFPVLKPKFPPGTKLMPITKTPIALATDIHTESGLNHLLSLHIEQHGTGYVPPMERELRRGLEQSPEKKSKAKEAKYLMYVLPLSICTCIQNALQGRSSRDCSPTDRLCQWQSDSLGTFTAKRETRCPLACRQNHTGVATAGQAQEPTRTADRTRPL